MKTKAGLQLLAVSAALLTSPVTGHAISRWGNKSIVSQQIGFKAELPDNVIETRPLETKRLALIMADQMMNPMLMNAPSYLMVGELTEDYPEFKNLDGDQIKARLQKLSTVWKEQPTFKNARVFANESATSTTVILVWAANKGVVLTGTRSETIDDSIQSILKSTKVNGKSL